jgi:hypothetical protein
MRAICLALLAAVIVAESAIPPAGAAQRRGRLPGPDCADRDFDRGRRHCETRQLTMPGGAPVEIDAGHNGGVWVRAADRADVAVAAHVLADAPTDAEARSIAEQVQVTATGGRVTATGPDTGGRRWWAVTFVVEVPPGTPVTAQARNGGVTLEDFTGEARLQSVNGPVNLRNVGGDIRGGTTNGPVTIELDGGAWIGSGLDMETRNGPVRIRVPEAFSANLELETVNGPVRIDHPGIPPQARTRRGGRESGRVTATLGSGGARIRATTVNGPVSVASR